MRRFDRRRQFRVERIDVQPIFGASIDDRMKRVHQASNTQHLMAHEHCYRVWLLGHQRAKRQIWIIDVVVFHRAPLWMQPSLKSDPYVVIGQTQTDFVSQHQLVLDFESVSVAIGPSKQGTPVCNARGHLPLPR